MLERFNLAERMIRAGCRYDPSVRDRRLLVQETKRMSAREAHRRVAMLAYPSMFLLVPASAVLAVFVSWLVSRLGGPDWLEAVLGYGIGFVPPAVFLSLNTFLWFLRLRRVNPVRAILLGDATRSLWYITLCGYCVAIAATAIAYSQWPDAFI